MRFLLDQGLPPRAASLLIPLGHEAKRVEAIGIAAAADVDVLRVASESGEIAVTLDKDFHALLAATSALRPSVIRFRIQFLGAEEAAERIADVAARCAGQLEHGAAVTVTRWDVRVRPLPLIAEKPL